jgi:GNAT superfamily N-acetyltransferase
MKGKKTVRSRMPADLEVQPVAPARWRDLERLFGPRGACAGCWCMYWRLTRSQWEAGKGAGNRRTLKKLVDSGATPGLLAYLDGEPVGWCAIAPREQFPVLERSRVLQRVDDQPVWSVVCFYVTRAARRRGVSLALLRGAVSEARKRGARIVEGYPIDPKRGPMADAFAWTGLAATFRQAGFREVARRSETRPIMRLQLRLRRGQVI